MTGTGGPESCLLGVESGSIGGLYAALPTCTRVERPARMVYEAGPTGYGLARRALA